MLSENTYNVLHARVERRGEERRGGEIIYGIRDHP
jgi:hypothetical protein